MKNRSPVGPLTILLSIAFLLAGYSLGRILEKRETEKVRQALRWEKTQSQQRMSQAAVAKHEGQLDRFRAEYQQKRADFYRSQLEQAHVPYKPAPGDEAARKP